MQQYSAVVVDDTSDHAHYYAEINVDEGDNLVTLHAEDSGSQAVELVMTIDEARELVAHTLEAIAVAEQNATA